jgi:ABC-type multidrug transport system fused ATPase/permease subunit
LDSDTESKVMEAVNGLKGKKTLILIAHRISTLKNCDRIYSLKMGKLVINN